MYEKIFNSDNPFWQGMGRVYDLAELNLLWLLCCLPIFTVGPSTAALYSALFRLCRGRESYLHRDFFRAFRTHFRRNTVVGVIVLLTGVFLAVDVRLAYGMGPGIGAFFMAFFFALLAFWSFTALWIFPVLSIWDGRARDGVTAAFTLSIRHLFRTLCMLSYIAAAVWLTRLLPVAGIVAFGLAAQMEAGWLLDGLKPWLPEDWKDDGAEQDSTQASS